MLDVKYVIDNLEEVIERLSTRTGDYSYLRQLPALEEKRKELILKADRLKAERNSQSKEIGKLKAQKKEEEAKALMEKINFDKDEIARLDKERAGVEDEIHEIMLKTPNIPDKSLPIGTDDSFNRPEKYWGDPTVFRFKPKAHWDIGQRLGYFDFDRAAKVSRKRLYRGSASLHGQHRIPDRIRPASEVRRSGLQHEPRRFLDDSDRRSPRHQLLSR